MPSSTNPYKVTYYKPGQPGILYCSFYDQFDDALSFAKGLSGPYLVFRTHMECNGESSWEMMPYGSYNDYRVGIQIMEYKWLILGLMLLVVYITVKIKSSTPNLN